MRRLVTGEPALLFYQGDFLLDAMRRSRVTEAEARAAIRAVGRDRFADVQALALETDGSFSVIKATAGAPASAHHSMLCDARRGD